MKRRILFLVMTCALVFVGNYLYQSFEARTDFNNRLKNAEKTCPDIYFVNKMPGVSTGLTASEFVQGVFQNYVTDVKGRVTGRLQMNYLNEKGLFIFREGGYFINHVDDQSGANKDSAGKNIPTAKRKDLFDTDLEWVSKNCSVKPSYVY